MKIPGAVDSNALVNKSVKKTAVKNKSAKKTAVKKKATKKVSKKKTVKKSHSSVTKKAVFIPHCTSLKPGNIAPSFEAKDQSGNIISSNDYKGKKIVLFFYPQDSTPTCTVEACNLRDEYKLLSKKNIVVLGVSPDDEKSHLKFATRNNLPFPLLADTDMKIIRAYDVWGIKQFMGKIYDGILRTTFIIDENGIIQHVITKVKSKEHGKQILDLIELE